MSDVDISIFELKKKCGSVLAYRELYHESLFQIAYDYLFSGCKSRKDYVHLVESLIKNKYMRNSLLNC